MYLSYRFSDKGYGNELEKIIISPAEADMSILNAVTFRPDMQLINPARTFATNIKSGAYDNRDQDDINAEAEVCNIVADAWQHKPEDNIFSITAELMRLYADLKKHVYALDHF